MIFKLAQDKVFIKFITPLCTALYCQSKASIGEIDFFYVLGSFFVWLITTLYSVWNLVLNPVNDYLNEKVICAKYYKISKEYLNFAGFLGRFNRQGSTKNFCNPPLLSLKTIGTTVFQVPCNVGIPCRHIVSFYSTWDIQFCMKDSLVFISHIYAIVFSSLPPPVLLYWQ